MKILEHTPTHLTFTDPSTGIFVARLLGGIFLVVGCLGLWLILDSTSFPDVGGIIFITVALIVGITFVFFLAKNTVYFDKTLGKLMIRSQMLFHEKNVEYPLKDITNVIVEKRRNSRRNTTTYKVALEIDSTSKTVYLSSLSFMRRKKAEERANLIRSFLNLPG